MNRSNHHRRVYEELVRTQAQNIYRFAVRMCGNKDEADDLVQQTFFEAWKSIGSLKDPKRARPWLFQILRHLNAHVIRDRSRRVQTNVDSDQLGTLSDNNCIDILTKLSDQELLQRALDSLDDRHKEPFLLVFLEDFTCREVAELLDIPLGTVLSRIHRARKSLRHFLWQLNQTNDHEGNIVKSPSHSRGNK